MSAASWMISPRATLSTKAVGLSFREFGRADEAGGLVGEGHVHREHVGLGEHLVEGAELRVERLGAVGVEVGIVDQNPHAEGAGADGHLAADAPRSDQPERLAVQLAAAQLRAVPGPRLHGAVGRGHAPGQREHERHGELGRRDGVPGGRVEHRDALLGGGLDVDRVHADAGAPDHLEAAGGGHRFARDLGGAPDDDGVHVVERGGQVRNGESRLGDQLEAGVLAERGQAVGGDLVGDEDAEGGGHAVSTSASAARTRSSSATVCSPMWPMRIVESLSLP